MASKRLCPGKSKFIKDSKDLGKASFRRLVARRTRKVVEVEAPLTAREPDRRKNEKAILEKVSGTADFLPASFLTEGAARSRAVCRIVVPTARGRSFGTGFLISPTAIMTNNHVLENEDQARDAIAEFRYEDGTVPVTVVLRPDRLFVTDTRLDYSIVACEGQGLADIPPIRLRRNPALITRYERLSIIQHPQARRKEIAIHDNKVLRVKDVVLWYSTDTEPGSSGSPAFNSDWELVGLHHAGWVENGKTTNEGIRVSAIVDHLIRRFNRDESAGSQDAIRELLSFVTDTSPYLGFFDSSGLAKSDHEIQVDGFQGSPEFADVGIWNIEHFNNRIADRRVTDVADVVDRLSMDAFGLSEVENGAMTRLRDELNSRGNRYDFVLRDTRGSQDLAVLFDQDTSTVTRRKDIADRHAGLLRKKTPAGKTAFPRWPLFAHCRVGDTRKAVEFIMIVVHLKAFGDVQSRARRRLAGEILADIIEDVRATEKLPVVLGGDFNERLDNDVLAAIKDTPDLVALTVDDATDGAISYVGARHRSLIDHIIVSSDARLGSIGGDDAAIVRLDRSVSNFSDVASDHVPIVFRMIYRPRPLPIDPSDGRDGVTVSIPDGADKVTLGFE